VIEVKKKLVAFVYNERERRILTALPAHTVAELISEGDAERLKQPIVEVPGLEAPDSLGESSQS